MNDNVRMIEATTRRAILGWSTALMGATALAAVPKLAFAASAGGSIAIDRFSPAGKNLGVVHVQKVVKSDAAWKQQLSADAFDVTRHAGTEAPFTGTYLKNHADGVYSCICCETALFDSHAKFESGTGWPSFYQPISRRNVVQSE